MTRIVAGSARGRRLRVPPGDGTRPTSDRVREALFSSLDAALGGFAGRRVLDLYAGSGALGLEALSRGAESVALVESDPRAVRTIRANAAAVGLPGVEVHHMSVERFLAGAPAVPFDVVLADPPYALDGAAVTSVLQALGVGRLADGAVVVVERDRRSPDLTWPAGIEAQRHRSYGESTLWYGRSS